MYVCTYVRMHACMYACVCMYVCMGNYVAMWLLNYSGCGTFRDFESDIFMNFRLWVSLLVNLACMCVYVCMYVCMYVCTTKARFPKTNHNVLQLVF